MNNNEDSISPTPATDRKCLLVRSHETLVQKNRIGHGWDVNFTEFDSAQDLIRHIGARIGRKANQVARFKSIKKGDIIVVPVGNSVVLGEALGIQHFEPTETAKHCTNQQEVQFFDPRGNLRKIPRTEFLGGTQSRFKIRQSVVDLAEFRSEIIGHFERFQAGKVPDAQSEFGERAALLMEAVKTDLLRNICTGKTRLAAGGKGLERLVARLLEMDGFEVIPLSTRVFPSSHADADIQATKSVMLGGSIELTSNKYLIQVKHHAGNSPAHGIEQLIKIKDTDKGKTIYADHELVFITTGEVGEDMRQLAEDNYISIMDGEGLVDWILNSSARLSQETKTDLGITDIPRLLEF